MAGLPSLPQRAGKIATRRGMIGGLLLMLAVGGAVTTWYAGLRDRFEPLNFGVVEPGKLYRSGQISRQVVRKTLEANHIGVVIDLSSKWEDTPDAREERKSIAELGIQRVNLTLRGNGLGDPEIYPRVLEIIVAAERAGKPVLVHCQSGSQRTGGIVAAYRMLIEGKSEQDAIAEMKAYGHRPHSNPKLIPFIREHLPHWREELIRDGVPTH